MRVRLSPEAPFFKLFELTPVVPKVCPHFYAYMAGVWGARPSDLRHSRLTELWNQGAFSDVSVELQLTAYAMLKGVMTDDLIKNIWDGSKSSKKAKKLKLKVRQIVDKNMPQWALKFESFMDSLNKNQRFVIETEYFHAQEEKPTQKELAKKLSMTEDNYKYHLKQAIKVLEKTYPEFNRVTRKEKGLNKVRKTKKKPFKLYLVETTGKTEVSPLPKKKMLVLNKWKRLQIKDWSYSRFNEQLKNINNTSDIKKVNQERELEKMFTNVKFEEIIMPEEYKSL